MERFRQPNVTSSTWITSIDIALIVLTSSLILHFARSLRSFLNNNLVNDLNSIPLVRILSQIPQAMNSVIRLQIIGGLLFNAALCSSSTVTPRKRPQSMTKFPPPLRLQGKGSGNSLGTIPLNVHVMHSPILDVSNWHSEFLKLASIMRCLDLCQNSDYLWILHLPIYNADSFKCQKYDFLL